MSLVTRRAFVRNGLCITGSIVALSFAPTLAHADCAEEKRTLGFGASDIGGTVTYSLSVGNWRLGDCELRNPVVSISGGKGVFKSEVCTHFTHHKDVWHFRLKLIQGSPTNPGKTVFDKQWDGPEMSEKDNPLFHPWHEEFTLDPAISPGALYAEVTSCC